VLVKEKRVERVTAKPAEETVGYTTTIR